MPAYTTIILLYDIITLLNIRHMRDTYMIDVVQMTDKMILEENGPT
jgi:hypothetical protein